MEKKKSPQFPFYFRDFFFEVRRWTANEKILYLELLSDQADTDPPWTIPKEDFEEMEIPEKIRRKFLLDENGYYNKRMREVLSKRKIHSEKQSENVRKRYQTSTKHLPLDNGNGNGNGNDNDKGKEIKIKDNSDPIIRYPYPESEEFLNAWQVWKDYKLEQFKFQYKPLGEQSALVSLSKMSQTPNEAIAIIAQSMGNGWKGLFSLDEKQVKRDESKKMFSKADQILKQYRNEQP